MSGVKLGGALKELRIHLCQTSNQSAGVREFIQKSYVTLKKDNPKFPILIRECNGVQPRIWARYEQLNATRKREYPCGVKNICYTKKGVERSAPLTNLSASDVFSTLKQIVK